MSDADWDSTPTPSFGAGRGTWKKQISGPCDSNDSTTNGFGKTSGFGSNGSGFGGGDSSNSFGGKSNGQTSGFGVGSGFGGGGDSGFGGGGDSGFGGSQKAGGGGRNCFKCGESGHMSRECPKGGGGGGGAKGSCFKCGEEGHMSRECPKGGGGGSRSCFKCGDEGHMSRDCPTGGNKSSGFGGGGNASSGFGGGSNASTGFGGAGNASSGFGGGSNASTGFGGAGNASSGFGGGGNASSGFGGGGNASSGFGGRGNAGTGFGGGGNASAGFGGSGNAGTGFGGGGGGKSSSSCFKCGEEGHMSRECPSGGGGGGSNKCFKCGEEGHMSRECPSGGGGGSNKCFKCGEEGHMSRECPSGGGGGGGSNKCFKCGEEGHMSRECPSGGGGGGGSNKCFNCNEEGHKRQDCPMPQAPRLNEDGKPIENYTPQAEEIGEIVNMNINAGINFDNCYNIPVEVTGYDKVSPIRSFNDIVISAQLMENISLVKYNRPTPVQQYAIPIILKGRDLMACAQTGSGKTAAYLIPIFQKMISEGFDSESIVSAIAKPRLLVVVPTRELCDQIYKQARVFSRGISIFPQRIYGGPATKYLLGEIQSGCSVLIATCGRLKQFLTSSYVSLENCKYVVLDEADKMLDMGFKDDVQLFLDNVMAKEERQIMMFSATFQRDIQLVARENMKESYLFLSVGLVGAANKDVNQRIIEVAGSEKKDKLLEILNGLREEAEQNDGIWKRTLVFVEQKRTADFIAAVLSQHKFPSTSIHGDRLQREREEALRNFRKGIHPVLVATDVAARGLDIKGVEVVINMDLAKDPDTYVHRIGRTGRCGNVGQSISFYDHSTNAELATYLRDCLMKGDVEVPEWLNMYAEGSFNTGVVSNHKRDIRKDVSRTRDMVGGDSWGDRPQTDAFVPSNVNADDDAW